MWFACTHIHRHSLLLSCSNDRLKLEANRVDYLMRLDTKLLKEADLEFNKENRNSELVNKQARDATVRSCWSAMSTDTASGTDTLHTFPSTPGRPSCQGHSRRDHRHCCWLPLGPVHLHLWQVRHPRRP